MPLPVTTYGRLITRALLAAAMLAGLTAMLPVAASPEEDQQKFQNFFLQRFPAVPFQEFANGVYAIDADARAQWESIEEFPPYEIAIEEGKELFNTPFKNGKGYADCFRNGGVGISGDFPYFDTRSKRVITLELAINECRKLHGEAALPYNGDSIAAITAYMAYTSRGQIIQIKIPRDAAALAAYEAGKRFFYARRGQLNMSCAHCHVDYSGQRLRSEILSPPLGHTSHWPVYRAEWQEVGTLHRRFAGCNEEIRAKPFALQSEEYRNLEYFLGYMSNGIPLNGPAFRK